MYKLLLVEDETALRDYMHRYIERNPDCGFYIHKEFGNGADAYEYLKNGGEADLVITDIRMPVMTGIELAKAIFEEHMSTQVIIISGYSEFEDARLAIKYNVKDYMIKPFELSKLKDTLRKIKEDLDQTTKENILNTKIKDELLLEAREEFFVDLLFEGINNKEEIGTRVNNLNFPFDTDEYHYDVIKLTISEDNNFIENAWHHPKESLSTAIHNLLSVILENAYVYTVIIINNDFYYTVFYNDEVKPDYNEIADKIKIISQLSINIKKIGRTFFNIYDELKPEDTIIDIFEKATLFLTYIRAYDIKEARNLLYNIFQNNYNKDFFDNFIASLIKISEEKYASKLTYITYSDDKETVINTILSILSDSKTDCTNAIEIVKNYIEENYSRNISKEDVSKLVFFNSVYFNRIFKQSVGMSFNDYLTKIRIQKSIELLNDENIKVYEVAKRVGYKNHKYFFHIFKLYTSYTPKEYRNSVLKNIKKENDCE